ncbi:glycosyltransferase [Endozoicomonadaceae bacterium StTr2]
MHTTPTKSVLNPQTDDPQKKKSFVILIGTMKMSGVSTWAVNLATSLEASGEHVTLLCMGEPGEVPIPDQLSITYLHRPRTNPALRILRLLMAHKLLPGWFKRMEWKVREYRVEKSLQKIHAATPIDLIIKDFTTDTPASIYNYPTAGVIHQLLSECWHIPAVKQHREDPYTCRVAVSRATQNDAAELNLSVGNVIYNPLPYGGNIEHKTTTGSDILFVGNVSKMKGALRLFDAYIESGLKNRLVYIGYGSAMNLLKKLISEHHLENRVIMKGYIADPKPFIKNSALLVLPSYHEAMGYSAIEALCLGTPVIVTRYAAAEEFIDPQYIVDGQDDMEVCSNLAVKMKQVLGSDYCFEYSLNRFKKMQPGFVAAEYRHLADSL